MNFYLVIIKTMNAITQTTYLRNPVFDYFFIAFIPVLAIASAYFVVVYPQHFDTIFILDLTLLGYHHVISTYTRIACSTKRLSEYKFFIVYLPPIVLLSVVGLALIGSEWLIATVYLHWQWWHYTRQSEGIAKSIRFKSQSVESGNELFNRAMFYLVPATCFLMMSSRQPESFLFMPVYSLPVPVSLANSLAFVTFGLWVAWFVMQIKALLNKTLSLTHFTYLLSHYAIYLVAYVTITNVTYGWLAINIWHNFQYVVFVWHYNANTFKNGVDKKQPFISWISQPKLFLLYFGLCLLLTRGIYSLVDLGISSISPYTLLPLTIIAYMTLNFHHYIVDSYIWKIRKPTIRKAIGIDA